MFQLDLCKPQACMNPLTRPNMGHDWNSSPVNFGDKVKYSCLTGFYFANDRNQASISVECLNGGVWNNPIIWPECVNSVTCVEPMAKPEGGARYWSGSKSYGTLLSYNCGPYAKFEPSPGTYNESITIECQWSKQWTSTSLPPCKSEPWMKNWILDTL